MRLIDADALKRKAQKVATEAWKMRIKSSVETILNQFIDWIDNAPTIEPEDKCGECDAWNQYKNYPRKSQWIPCGERLPEIGEHYVSEPCIVYCTNGAYGFAELEENIFGQVGWNCERDDEYHEPLGEVIAWMPLPEPYEEGAK